MGLFGSPNPEVEYGKSFVKFAKIIMLEGYVQMLMYVGKFDIMMNEQHRAKCAGAMRTRVIHQLNDVQKRLEPLKGNGRIMANALFDHAGLAKQYADYLESTCKSGNFSKFKDRAELFAYFEKPAKKAADEIRASFERGAHPNARTEILDFLHKDCMKEFHNKETEWLRAVPNR